MDDKMDVDSEIRFKTNDNKRICFTESEATCSVVLKRMLESARQTGQIDLTIPIDSKVLTNILKWCQAQLGENDDWKDKFVASFREDELLRLLHAANYLDIESLQTACSKYFANKWQGLKIDEIRRRYNIEDDLSPEEELQILQENKGLGLGD